MPSASRQTSKVRSTIGATRRSSSARVIEKVEIERAAAGPVRHLGHAHARLILGGELDLQRLGRGAQPLERRRVGARVVAMHRQKLVGHLVGERVIDVVATEKGVARGGQHLEDVVREIEQRDVEGSAAEVVDREPLGRALAVAVGERRGGRLVEDAQHLEPRDPTGDLGRRALQVVEVRGHRDHGALDRRAERRFGDGFGLAQDERADFGQRVGFAARDHERRLSRPLAHLERESLRARRTSSESQLRPIRRLIE